MTYTGFTTFPSIKQYHLFVKCFIRSGRETEGEKCGFKTAILGENLVFNGRYCYNIAGYFAIWPQCNVRQ